MYLTHSAAARNFSAVILTGPRRAAIFQLLPLAAAESAEVSLFHGGIPEVAARPSAARTRFRS